MVAAARCVARRRGRTYRVQITHHKHVKRSGRVDRACACAFGICTYYICKHNMQSRRDDIIVKANNFEACARTMLINKYNNKHTRGHTHTHKKPPHILHTYREVKRVLQRPRGLSSLRSAGTRAAHLTHSYLCACFVCANLGVPGQRRHNITRTQQQQQKHFKKNIATST